MIPNFELIIDTIRKMIVTDNTPAECVRGDIVRVLERIAIESEHPISRLQKQVWYERREDMSTAGMIGIYIQDDGDIIIKVKDDRGRTGAIEFCSVGSGGGRSQRVRDALIELAVAIQEENAINPQ